MHKKTNLLLLYVKTVGVISISGPGQAKAFGQHFTISSSDKTLFYADEKEAVVGTGKLRVTGTFGHFKKTQM